MANAGHYKHEWEQSFQIVPIHLWSTRGSSSVPDYGYSSRLLHPVSPTIFRSPELSCTAFYNITFQPSIRFFRRIAFLDEVPNLATFPHFFRSAVGRKTTLIQRSVRSQSDFHGTMFHFVSCFFEST